ncbi:MAG: hypothetical protein Q9184_004484 [Pyrenodesmia sp. 2 TL-2023]
MSQHRPSSSNAFGITSDRTLRKRMGLDQKLLANEWGAEVMQVQCCDSTTYDGGRGFQTRFEYDSAPATAYKPRCFVRMRGGLPGLTLTLEINQVHWDPNPTILHTFTIPAANNAFVTLRLFDKLVHMEIHTDPPRTGRRKPVGDYWSIAFRNHTPEEKRAARALLNTIESFTREMPDAWFKHRNYFTKGNSAVPQETTEGSFRYELSSGHHFDFTGHFATAPILEALGHEQVRLARPVSLEPEDEEGNPVLDQPRTLRSMIRKDTEKAYAFSSLDMMGEVSVNVAKGGRRDKRLSKLKTRRAMRASNAIQAINASTASNLVQRQETPPYYFSNLDFPPPAQPTGEQTHAAESVGDAESANADGEDADEPAKEWLVRRILGQDVDDDGNTIYHIDWEPKSDGEEWPPSWEEEKLVSEEALQVWREEQAKKAKNPKKRAASTRGRGRGRGSGSKRAKK